MIPIIALSTSGLLRIAAWLFIAVIACVAIWKILSILPLSPVVKQAIAWFLGLVAVIVIANHFNLI